MCRMHCSAAAATQIASSRPAHRWRRAAQFPETVMSEARDMFALLRQSADAKAVDAIERLVTEAPDHHLCRINAPALAASEGISEEVMVAAFLHAARIGMFDISWN